MTWLFKRRRKRRAVYIHPAFAGAWRPAFYRVLALHIGALTVRR